MCCIAVSLYCGLGACLVQRCVLHCLPIVIGVLCVFVQRYLQFELRSYVQSNPNVKWYSLLFSNLLILYSLPSFFILMFTFSYFRKDSFLHPSPSYFLVILSALSLFSFLPRPSPCLRCPKPGCGRVIRRRTILDESPRVVLLLSPLPLPSVVSSCILFNLTFTCTSLMFAVGVMCVSVFSHTRRSRAADQ